MKIQVLRKLQQIGTLILLMLFLVTSCVFYPDNIGLRPADIPHNDYSTAIKYTELALKRAMKMHKIPGIAVALIDGQNIIYENGFGVADLETKIPITRDTIFNAGSIAKLFTGIEIMRMYEQGLLDIDTPVSQYLPDFSIKSNWSESASDSITIRDILTHRSGLPRGSGLLEWYWDARPEVMKAQVDSAAELYQAYPAGHWYKYSNFGYNILGRIIEAVHGLVPPAENAAVILPYHMQEMLFDPLDMESSGFGSRALLYGEAAPQPISSGYYLQDKRVIPYNRFDIINLASGNLNTTLRDLQQFAFCILGGGVLNFQRIISSESLDMMFTPQSGNAADLQANGLTWFTDEVQLSEKVVFHSGTNQGHISLISLIPDKGLGVIFLANADAFEEVHNQLAMNILGLMLETKYGIKPESPAVPDKISLDAEALKKFTGTYIVNDELVKVYMGTKGLHISYQNIQAGLDAVSGNSFVIKNAGLFGMKSVSLTFYYDEVLSGKVMILSPDGSFYIRCPEYPVSGENELLPLWQKIVGSYQQTARYPSTFSDDILGTTEIFIKDGVLMTSSGKVLLPINDTKIKIVGGIFDNEIMDLDLSAGKITWQNLVFELE